MNPRTIAMRSVSLEAADALVDAALSAAQETGIDAAVAVVDATGHLRAFKRSDGAAFLTAEVAIAKAWTSASYGYHTHEWNEYVTDPKVAPMVTLPQLMAVGGGYALFDDGHLVGGLGLSGGSHEQDQDACLQAMAQLGFPVERVSAQ